MGLFKLSIARVVFCLFLLTLAQAGYSQALKTIIGKVSDTTGTGLPNVSVQVKGKTTGVVSDAEGKYSIRAAQGEELMYSSIGYTAERREVGSSSVINVTLSVFAESAGTDVVVTALGIKRSERSLNYSAQQISGEEMTKVKNANFVNSLNGKVAGVTINQSSSGVGGAAKVVMRGAKSVDGNSNALYVIDGVPMLSMTSPQGSGRFASTGSTEGLADINPDDIESMTILTGAAGAALYGSDAANGAVIITTKKGKAGRMNVIVSSNAEFSQPFIMPAFQNKYGSDGKIASWGRELPDDAEKYHPKDFFEKPYTLINSVALSGGSDKNQVYLSFASTNSKGLIPNNLYNRYNLTFRNTSYLLNDRFRIDLQANYISQDNRNMVNQGEYMNPLVGAYLLPRGDGLEKTRIFEKYNPSAKIYEQVWGDFKGTDGLFSGSYQGDYSLQNPYWIAYRNLRDINRERYILSLDLAYDIKKWSPSEKWDVGVRARRDNTRLRGTDKRFASTLSTLDISKTGYFGLYQGVETQTYLDVLTNLKRDFDWDNIGRVSLTANLGASLQDSRTDGTNYRGPLRADGIPNKFNTFNIDQGAQKTLNVPEGWIEQKQSVFGMVEMGYNNYLFLTLTGRNEWPTQLANSAQSSYFYYSAGLSAVITDMLSADTRADLFPVLSYLKGRLAYGSVASPYGRGLTTPTYKFNYDTKTWETVTYFPIGKLYPERTNSFEAGFSSKWLNRKLSLDFTYYNANTLNQTIEATISRSTGYNAIYFQTGKVQNRGVELGLGYDIVSNNRFSWNTYFTMSYNKNQIKSLLENYVNPVTGERESKEFLEKNSFGSLKYILKTGGSLGDIYTDADFRRNQDGRIFIDNNGNVSSENFADGKFEKLGSVLPDYNMGWRNDFRIGSLNLGATFTGRLGGLVVSMTEAALDHYGVSKNSADARDAGGVEINGNRVSAKNYFETRGLGRLAQYYTYSADNFRLQEAYIGYTIPRKVFRNVMDITVSLVGRNLLMLYSKAPFDPELISSTGNYAQGLDYFMMPSLRSYGINLKVNF